jgi:hypothetical protein
MTRRELIEDVRAALNVFKFHESLDVPVTLDDATKIGASVVDRLAHCRREIVAHKETLIAGPLAIIGLREKFGVENAVDPEPTHETPAEVGYGHGV